MNALCAKIVILKSTNESENSHQSNIIFNAESKSNNIILHNYIHLFYILSNFSKMEIILKIFPFNKSIHHDMKLTILLIQLILDFKLVKKFRGIVTF